ncbi:DUF6325 family protein [Marmoricola sp. RAF53]|uniref:DUF6325 family protein n=1 Tax=Marmoricola sp. RAF53 TaxID=3233059 RepID=UPI003F952662
MQPELVPATTDLDLVEYFVVTVASLSATAAVADALQELTTAGQLRVLDVVGVATAADGTYALTEPEVLAGFAALRPAAPDALLSEDDIALACSAMPPGTSALIVVAEDRWAGSLAEAARAGGGRLAGGERIPRHRLEQARRRSAGAGGAS